MARRKGQSRPLYFLPVPNSSPESNAKNIFFSSGPSSCTALRMASTFSRGVYPISVADSPAANSLFFHSGSFGHLSHGSFPEFPDMNRCAWGHGIAATMYGDGFGSYSKCHPHVIRDLEGVKQVRRVLCYAPSFEEVRPFFKIARSKLSPPQYGNDLPAFDKLEKCLAMVHPACNLVSCRANAAALSLLPGA